MNEYARTVIFILSDIIFIATVIEIIKKLFSNYKVEEGKAKLKTRLTKLTIISTAIFLSMMITAVLYFGGVLIGAPIMLAFYIPLVFVCQWIIDIKLVKAIFEKIINKAISRI